MDFILGIFTGIGLTMFLGYYLNERNKKRGVPKSQNPPPPPKAGQFGIYINGQFIAAGTPMQWDDTQLRREYTPLEQQLQEAIANENFEEAARLRDLINKK